MNKNKLELTGMDLNRPLYEIHLCIQSMWSFVVILSVVGEKSMAKLDPIDCIWENGFDDEKRKWKKM